MIRPANLREFEKIRKAFTEFLVSRGSEIISTPNYYEVMRFTANGGTLAIIYRKENDRITHWSNSAAEAWNAFKNGDPEGKWRAHPKTTRNAKTRHQIRTLLERDGDACLLCGLTIPHDEITIEHIVAVAHGGPNHISNLALMHRECNRELGHLSAAEKFAAAFKRRTGP